MTDAGGDPRPRPQYGEYATPEEQRARIRVPDPALTTPHEATDPAPLPVPSAPRAAASSPGRVVDRLVTWGLLGYGLVTVVSSISALTDFGAFAQSFLAVLGVDAQLADPAAGRPWGIAAAIVLGVSWVLTAVLSSRSMRAGRLSFWIPLVGGAVANLVSGGLMLVPIMSDPAVWDALTQTAG
jgi:Family of unknown function (DUF6264)